MKKFLRYCWLLLAPWAVNAQVDTAAIKPPSDSAARPRVAVFLPLYLDSAFDAAGNYRYDNSFPKFMHAGLEFYEGMELALDTLTKERVRLDVQIYDTRSAGRSAESVMNSPGFQGTGLIIGVVASGGEEQQFAAAALRQHIPFINVNYPNDAGITGNPSLVILNST
ncbi:MAG TPA: amino acid ABC transporter substrate-binding protein, partial [Puia sp.]|nr:amino acid ABC transporter substrate-binding protein [Puia sp.]